MASLEGKDTITAYQIFIKGRLAILPSSRSKPRNIEYKNSSKELKRNTWVVVANLFVSSQIRQHWYMVHAAFFFYGFLPAHNVGVRLPLCAISILNSPFWTWSKQINYYMGRSIFCCIGVILSVLKYNIHHVSPPPSKKYRPDQPCTIIMRFIDHGRQSGCWCLVLAYSCHTTYFLRHPHFSSVPWSDMKISFVELCFLSLFDILTSPFSLTCIGVSKTIHWTISAHPGVVKDPV